mgnify:FL=1
MGPLNGVYTIADNLEVKHYADTGSVDDDGVPISYEDFYGGREHILKQMQGTSEKKFELPEQSKKNILL